MSKRFVIDAGPLIALGKISQIGLIEGLCSELVVPSGVAHEVAQGPGHDPARIWLEHDGRERIRELEIADTVLMSWDLGRGETEVLTWARHHVGYEGVIDDLAARRCATALQIPIRGTVGLLDSWYWPTR